jgi:hypothetical protein
VHFMIRALATLQQVPPEMLSELREDNGYNG